MIRNKNTYKELRAERGFIWVRDTNYLYTDGRESKNSSFWSMVYEKSAERISGADNVRNDESVKRMNAQKLT